MGLKFQAEQIDRIENKIRDLGKLKKIFDVKSLPTALYKLVNLVSKEKCKFKINDDCLREICAGLILIDGVSEVTIRKFEYAIQSLCLCIQFGFENPQFDSNSIKNNYKKYNFIKTILDEWVYRFYDYGKQIDLIHRRRMETKPINEILLNVFKYILDEKYQFQKDIVQIAIDQLISYDEVEKYAEIVCELKRIVKNTYKPKLLSVIDKKIGTQDVLYIKIRASKDCSGEGAGRVFMVYKGSESGGNEAGVFYITLNHEHTNKYTKQIDWPKITKSYHDLRKNSRSANYYC